MIYLDCHSATKPCAAALERMGPYLQEHWGASFSPHKMGQELIVALDTRYQMIYDLVGAKEKDVFIFTSSGAEAINQVFWTVFLEKARKEGKCHIIVSRLEDVPTMQCAQLLERLGCTIKIAPVDGQGQIDVDKLAALINPRTALISVTMAQGLTGVIQPMDAIERIAKEKNVLLHFEATYALGKIPLDEMRGDYLTFSGDRIHSVKSSGGLFVKEGRPLAPFILGGQLDVSSLMALSAAAQQSALYLDMMNLEVMRLRNLLESRLCGSVVYQNAPRLPNTTTVRFPKAHQEALLYLLNRKGVYASIGGSYCGPLSEIVGDACAISFSLSRMTTEEEIVRASFLINDAVKQLQTISEAI